MVFEAQAGRLAAVLRFPFHTHSAIASAGGRPWARRPPASAGPLTPRWFRGLRRFGAAASLIGVLFAQVPPILPPSPEDETWFGLHPTAGSPPEFVYPFDGRAPRVAAVLHNHHETPSPGVRVASVRVNGRMLDSSVEISSGGPLVIPPFDYALPSISGAGVYDGSFGPPPAVGETKTYRFEFTYALAPGVPPPNNVEPLTVTHVQEIKFTNLGDTPVLTGPNSYSGVLRVDGLRAGASVGNPRVEVATPFSPWFAIPLAPIASSGGTAFAFSQALPLRNDWHVRFSADGFETRIVPLGFYVSPPPSLDITLAPAAAPDVDYRKAATLTVPTGAWRGVVAESEGTFVVFPGQRTWKQTATDAEARAQRSAGRIAKYRFDGTKVWEHAPGWETWGGDMTPDGRFVAYALTPLARSFYTPTENKLVLLDGATGTPLWTKAAAPNDTALGRKLDAIEVRFSPNARWLAVGSLGTGQVTLFERATGALKWSAPNTGDNFAQVQKIAFSPDSEFLFCGGNDGALRKLRVSDGALVWRAFVYGTPQLEGLDVTADGTWLVVGSRSGDASVIRTADSFMQWQGQTQSGATVLAPDARHFATSGGQIYQTLEGTMRGRTTASGVAQFTPDGRHVLQLGREFALYDLGGKRLKTFEDSGLPANTGDDPLWAHLTRDGRYAIVLARDLPNPPQAGIVIYERRAPATGALAPAIVAGPLAQTLTAGTAATLSVTAAGTPPLAYRWQHDGVDVAGAESAALVLARAAAADEGTYTAIVSNAAGTVASTPAAIAVTTRDPFDPPRIANLSVRAGIAATPLIVGFAVGGPGTSGSKPLLVRGAGPALDGFGLDGALRDPRVTLFSGANALLENDNWAGDARVTALAAQVGAFPFADRASADAAMVVTAVGGSFTVHLAGSDAAGGTALAEIYDGSAGFAATTPRLVNISARADIGGASALIAGFVVAGPASKTMLIRGIGPTLAQFGVTGALADPQVTLFRGDASLATNDDWYDAPNALRISTAATEVGAFALATSSRDAALLISLPPGSYTAQVMPANAGTGSALVEVYEVP